ncbi:SAM-dependent methyltransferase [Chitinophagaceae bacterium MMS25-I14]
MIPVPIAENALSTLSPDVASCTLELKYFFAENVRTARRFLKQLHPQLQIEPLIFSEIDKHSGPDITLLKKWLKEGHDVGVMSESGCPGVADPGAVLAQAAHAVNAPVVPLTGPSSLLLALMASGLNGQSFAFNGYLPVKEPARSQRIKYLENHSKKENQTQLFIETPYRNNTLLDELLKTCLPGTQLTIAQNLTGNPAYIKTKTIAQWQKEKPALEKLPAVFLLLA